jgi:hypothetical protein
VGLLLLHGGATNATDTYFYLFTWGLTPSLILVVGVMYPMLLNTRVASRRALRRIRFTAPASAVLCVLVGYAWLATNRQMSAALFAIALLMSANAALQARIYFRAVAAEAGGDALWISGLALPANISACAVLAWPWDTSTAATTAMVGAITAGNAGCLAAMSRWRIGQRILDAVADERAPSPGSSWYFAKATAGYAAQLVLSTLAVTLPASGVTVLNLASKFVGALATTLINAILPILVHQSTESMAGAKRFLRMMAACLVVVGALATVAVAIVDPQYTMAAVVMSLWLLTSSAAAVAQRASFRFLPARAAGAVVTATIGIVAVTVAAASAPGFDVTVLLCAYAALDAAAATLLLWQLKDRMAGLSTFAALIGLVVLAGTALA